MRENQLNELQGVSILTKDFFNKLIRRIESTKPLAGANITIKQEENGILISGGGGVGSVADYSAITLNVCSNGEPAEILVLGKPVEE
jgi:hypothetical protein|tara:strand:+ start:1040 stop:1300 length:261 start_codon:yes stop_codon:yes gene_type:complete